MCDGSYCLLEKECPFHVKDKFCFWRPYQLVTWGRRENNKFVALKEAIRSSWITLDRLRDLLDVEITVKKLAGILTRNQRTSCKAANPYGLGLHQFATVIETEYMEALDPVYVRMAVGLRDPVVETNAQAKKRLGISGKKEQPAKKKETTTTSDATAVTELEEEVVDADNMYENDAEQVAYDEVILKGDEPPFGDDDDDNY